MTTTVINTFDHVDHNKQGQVWVVGFPGNSVGIHHAQHLIREEGMRAYFHWYWLYGNFGKTWQNVIA